MDSPTFLLVEELPAARLRALLDKLDVEVDVDRRSRAEMSNALARSAFLDVASALTLAEIRVVCSRHGVKTTGTRAEVVSRIAEKLKPAAPKHDVAPSAAEAGSLKAALRKFAIDAPSFRGVNAVGQLTTNFLACFGWDGGKPASADVPADLHVIDHSQRATRQVALHWPERRVLLDVVEPEVALDVAWKTLLPVCLQLDTVPQFVMLTNFRDFHLYDTVQSRDVPRLSLSLDELARHSEAFPFLAKDWIPGSTPKIVNVGKVSREVADLVARLYRSLLAEYPRREADAIQFTLQCIITMFAEDIGLMPKDYFTQLLYEGARNGDMDRRLRELFKLMSSKDAPEPRPVAFFNGGLFKDPVTLQLGDAQLTALTRAAEANWKHVDPHIFGSVFQGIMGDQERHATGAHYTAHDDIMRVVGPTLIEPWRRKIAAAKKLETLLSLRQDLFNFRVLDPACGSGNFLYVSFRELYKLDTELLARMREFSSAKDIGWDRGIPTTNFHGIDTNRFAVELAKVTLNIAKKIAFEDRRETLAAIGGQLALEIDPSLPLDTLDRNIICADALFTEWPKVDAIVGNPPFLGGLKIRQELGADYLARLKAKYPGVNGRADFCSFWFRRAHDHIDAAGRVGLVATNTIREGNTREAATDYIVENGGTITHAVSSQQWPGVAIVNVSMVNWVKGPALDEPRRLVVDGVVYEPSHIATSLQLEADLSTAKQLAANENGTSQGLVLGTKEFQFDSAVARTLCADKRARPFIKPVAVSSHWLSGRMDSDPEYVVDLSLCSTEAEAQRSGAAFDYVRTNVFPLVREKARTATTDHYKSWLRTWWRPMWPREEFLREIDGSPRIIVCSRHAARPIFAFMSPDFFATESMQLFSFSDDYSFGVIQSNHHWQWALGVGSKIVDTTRYTSKVWETFPWPQDPPEDAVAMVAAAGRALRAVRDTLMAQNGWSLRALHQAADLEGPHPLNDAQRVLDEAVAAAYGLPEGQSVTEYLLDLNRCLAEDEAAERPVFGPGLPAGFDRTDPRWTSDDCIRPPAFFE